MKFTDRGYWISKHYYYQSLVHYLYYAFKFRSFTFFSACNPLIDLGGMLDEKKSDIYNVLPAQVVPKTIICRKGEQVHHKIKNQKLEFPLIIKPNVGFKGHLVLKLHKSDLLDEAIEKMGDREFLIQEFVSFKKEYSILYYRLPKSGSSGVSSLIEKKYPTVTGDGSSNLKSLILNYKNPFLQKDWVLQKWRLELNTIPAAGKEIILDDIGNYSRGARFFSLNQKISDRLINSLDSFFNEVEGIDFCRIDLKSPSFDAVLQGNFKVLEINGAKSEPLHIYDPKAGFLNNSKDILKHWRIIASIVKERKSLSFEFPSFQNGMRSLQVVKRSMK